MVPTWAAELDIGLMMDAISFNHLPLQTIAAHSKSPMNQSIDSKDWKGKQLVQDSQVVVMYKIFWYVLHYQC